MTNEEFVFGALKKLEVERKELEEARKALKLRREAGDWEVTLNGRDFGTIISLVIQRVAPGSFRLLVGREADEVDTGGVWGGYIWEVPPEQYRLARLLHDFVLSQVVAGEGDFSELIVTEW